MLDETCAVVFVITQDFNLPRCVTYNALFTVKGDEVSSGVVVIEHGGRVCMREALGSTPSGKDFSLIALFKCLLEKRQGLFGVVPTVGHPPHGHTFEGNDCCASRVIGTRSGMPLVLNDVKTVNKRYCYCVTPV